MTPDEYKKADKMLRRDEAERRFVYECGTGKQVKGEKGKLTIGVGHNLEAKPLSDAVIALLLCEDILEAETDAMRYVGVDTYHGLSTNRKLALVNLAFNIGYTRLSKFTDMRDAIRMNDFALAGVELLDSKWRGDVDPKDTADGRDDRVYNLLAKDKYDY